MIYFCPTPIGNLKDITNRTLEVLENVDIIAAEDTRNTLKLLNNFNIKKRMIAYHKFNEKEQAENIISLSYDNDIAVVSDAGLPGISDPGEVLVKRLVEEEIEFLVLPGPNAALTALVLSGLDTEHFFFYGFLNSKTNTRKKELMKLANFPYTIIFYESPHRLEATLNDIAEVFGERRMSISRELTKMYEQTLRNTTTYFRDNFNEIKLKGEFVLVVEGKNEEKVDIDIEALLRDKLEEGIKKSQAVKEVAKEYDIPKNEVYKISLEI